MAGLKMAKLKEKARAFLYAHESLTLQRQRRNQPLTDADLNKLETCCWTPAVRRG